MHEGDVDKERANTSKTAARLANLLSYETLVSLRPAEDLIQFLKATAKIVISNNPENAARVMKAVSSFGAIRISGVASMKAGEDNTVSSRRR